jgi:queuine tRNA-ribosyltransferase
VKANEILGSMLLTWVNVAYYQSLMAGMREAIGKGRLADFAAETAEDWSRGEAEAA